MTKTFGEVMREYISARESTWGKAMRIKASYFENKIFAPLSNIKIDKLNANNILDALSGFIKAQKRPSFNGALSFASCVCGWAVQCGLCQRNIVRDIEPRYLFGKVCVAHRASFANFADIQELVKRISTYSGSVPVRICALLQLYTATRPSEARLASWDEFDFECGVWKIPAWRMKMKKAHEIVLSKQVLKLLLWYKGWCEQRNNNANSKMLFVLRQKPLNPTSVRMMLIRLGYSSADIVPHGFRASFATIANELRAEHGYDNDIVQACLAHDIQNSVSKAYNHATYKIQRANLMQWWGDKLGYIKLGFQNQNIEQVF